MCTDQYQIIRDRLASGDITRPARPVRAGAATDNRGRFIGSVSEYHDALQYVSPTFMSWRNTHPGVPVTRYPGCWLDIPPGLRPAGCLRAGGCLKTMTAPPRDTSPRPSAWADLGPQWGSE